MATYTVTITAGQGFSGTVNLSVSGVPSRATATFNPASIVNSGTSVLTIDTRAERAEANSHADHHGHQRWTGPLGQRDLDHSVSADGDFPQNAASTTRRGRRGCGDRASPARGRAGCDA